MDKYLGNKRGLLDAIDAVVQRHCGPVATICDMFAGTTNVGRYFRRHGMNVLSNDINRFSYVLGRCYLGTSEYPTFQRLPRRITATADRNGQLRRLFGVAVRRDNDTMFPAQEEQVVWKSQAPLVGVLTYLNDLRGKAQPRRRYVVDYYTAFGRMSRFHSVRGSTGLRNYFSEPNAVHLDAILETVRAWWQDGLLTDNELSLLMTSILEEVVITANVNGTFHDFNRRRLWPNALQQFVLKVPLVHASDPSTVLACDDALRICQAMPAHDVLYLDPPYNFRQYTAYYHFLNFIAAYPFLDDLAAYLSDLEHVRGQNMRDDFGSEFCARDRFIEALARLIDGCNSKYVVMSYYSGRNHWNHWAETPEPTDEGRNHLWALFSNDILFSSTEMVPVLAIRKNYQSRIGERKTDVNEHLFVAKRRRSRARLERADTAAPMLSTVNEGLGLPWFARWHQESNAARTWRSNSRS